MSVSIAIGINKLFTIFIYFQKLWQNLVKIVTLRFFGLFSVLVWFLFFVFSFLCGNWKLSFLIFNFFFFNLWHNCSVYILKILKMHLLGMVLSWVYWLMRDETPGTVLSCCQALVSSTLSAKFAVLFNS